MFQKLQIQLTLLCTFITGIILFALTGACLLFAVRNINQTNFTSFLSEANTTISHLQEQKIISHQWLNQLQSEKSKIRVFLYDNGHPLFYQQYHISEQDETLCGAIMADVQKNYGINLSEASVNKLTTHEEFEFQSVSHKKYYVSAGTIPKKNGSLNFLLICPLSGQQSQQLRLTAAVLTADVIGVLLLFFFFRRLILKLLLPVSESQKKQAMFISSASHELRSPLAVFRSGLEALSKTDDSEQQKHFQKIMFSECTRMGKLIDHMLLLANADSQSLPVHIDKCQPDGILLNVYEKYETLCRKKQLRFTLSLPEDITNDCYCDVERIEQVLSILIDNAISYTPDGGTIRLSLQMTEHNCRFSVADTGPGIPDSQKELIFERFYRADTAHTSKDHFGLGLCIAKEIIRKHKGTLWVEDAPGGGSIFFAEIRSCYSRQEKKV